MWKTEVTWFLSMFSLNHKAILQAFLQSKAKQHVATGLKITGLNCHKSLPVGSGSGGLEEGRPSSELTSYRQ